MNQNCHHQQALMNRITLGSMATEWRARLPHSSEALVFEIWLQSSCVECSTHACVGFQVRLSQDFKSGVNNLQMIYSSLSCFNSSLISSVQH